MPNEDGLRVTFSLTEEDIFQFLHYHRRRHPITPRVLFVGSVISAVLVFGLAGYLVPEWGLGFRLLCGLLAAIVFTPAYGWLQRRLLRWLAHQSNRTLIGNVGEHSVEISPEGFAMASAFGEGIRKWNGIDRIMDTPSYFCFFLGKEDSAIPIPRRAFRSSEAAETFLRAAREWHAAATGSRS
jgi:hypothetical protein